MTALSPTILGIDTSTRCCTIAITRGTHEQGEVLAEISLSSSVTHSRRIITLVDRIFSETELSWDDINGIAIGLGPGSFTGLRIGMATAKGFAAATGKKLLGVSTLTALAACCGSQKRICAVIDARKKEVYTAFYRRSESGILETEKDVRALSPESLCDEIDEPTLMVGDGVNRYSDVWLSSVNSGNIEFASAYLHGPSGASIALLGGDLYQNEDFLDVASSAPLYVRASDAELNLAQKRKGK